MVVRRPCASPSPGIRTTSAITQGASIAESSCVLRNHHGSTTEQANLNVTRLLCSKPNKSQIRTHVIPAKYGFAFHINKGSHFRIVDLHGSQVVDMMAWRAPYSPSTTCEHFSTSYTQYNLHGAAPPTVGECLYSNHDNKMFEVIADTVKVHDMRFMACNPGFYRRVGQEGHRNCATNIAEALTEFLVSEEDGTAPMVGTAQAAIGSDLKVEWYQVHDPFNVFQNTPYYSIKGGLNTSRPGDYIEFKANMDAVVALSCCPYDSDNFNGGKVTDVAVTWEVGGS